MEDAMDLRDGVGTSESRFASYVEAVSSGVGHADRVAPLRIVVAILVVAALVAAGLLLGFHH
jgi:hypothetical protein